MKQSYKSFNESVEGIKRELLASGQHGALVQKIWGAPHLVCLKTRLPGKSLFLYLGRGHSHEYLFSEQEGLKAIYRINDLWVEFLRKNVEGCRILDIEQLENKRAVVLRLKRGRVHVEFFVFFESHKLRWAVLEPERMYISWLSPSWMEIVDGSQKMVIGRIASTEAEKEMSGDPGIEDYEEFIAKKITSSNKRRNKALRRTLTKIESEYRRAVSWSELKDSLVNNQMDLTPSTFSLEGKTIKFFQGENEFQKRDLLFKRVKSYEKQVDKIFKRMEEIRKKADKTKTEYFDKSELRKLLINVERVKPKQRKENAGSKFTKVKFGELVGAIGKNAKENDLIRKEFGNKNDYWFHLDSVTGAHLILKTESLDLFKVEDWEAIGGCLAEYSGVSLGEVTIMYSQLKYVKGIKGATGAVRVSKPKYKSVQQNSGWRKILTISE